MGNWLYVGIGGFLGSISRYYVTLWVATLTEHPLFPYGTLTVNVLGCFIIGFLGALAETREVLTPQLRLLILMGFLGGFTTFSSFGYEAYRLLEANRLNAVLWDVGLQVGLGLLAVWLGSLLERLIF